MAFERRQREDPLACQCPLMTLACAGQADGEDRLCSNCRTNHRPDFISPEEAARVGQGYPVDREGNRL